MKPLLLTTIAAVLLVGCGESQQSAPPETPPSEPVAEAAKPEPPPEPPTAKAPDISIHEAAALGNIEAVKQHIAAKTDLNQKDPNPNGAKATALGIAAALGHTEVAIALIEGGANVDQRDKDGSTPLHSAAFLCYPKIVQALLDKGADKNARNNSGSTPLESVEVPWEIIKGIYEPLDAIIFKPLGAPLDYERIQATRPEIVEILR